MSKLWHYTSWRSTEQTSFETGLALGMGRAGHIRYSCKFILMSVGTFLEWAANLCCLLIQHCFMFASTLCTYLFHPTLGSFTLSQLYLLSVKLWWNLSSREEWWLVIQTVNWKALMLNSCRGIRFCFYCWGSQIAHRELMFMLGATN